MPAQLSQKPGSSAGSPALVPRPYPTGGGLRAAAGVFWLKGCTRGLCRKEVSNRVWLRGHRRTSWSLCRKEVSNRVWLRVESGPFGVASQSQGGLKQGVVASRAASFGAAYVSQGGLKQGVVASVAYQVSHLGRSQGGLKQGVVASWSVCCDHPKWSQGGLKQGVVASA